MPLDVLEIALEEQRRPECDGGGGDARSGIMQKERQGTCVGAHEDNMCPEYQVGEKGTGAAADRAPPPDPRLRRSGDRCAGGRGSLALRPNRAGDSNVQSRGARSLAWPLWRGAAWDGRRTLCTSATQQPNERRPDSSGGVEAESGTLISSLTGSCSMMDGRR